MNAQDLLAKAIQAAASAKVLLDTGDADGACREDTAWAVSQAADLRPGNADHIHAEGANEEQQRAGAILSSLIAPTP